MKKSLEFISGAFFVLLSFFMFNNICIFAAIKRGKICLIATSKKMLKQLFVFL